MHVCPLWNENDVLLNYANMNSQKNIFLSLTELFLVSNIFSDISLENCKKQKKTKNNGRPPPPPIKKFT